MKTGISDFIRPTTAKKLLVSPKTNKNHKVKTENKHLDFAQLCDEMYDFFVVVKKPS